MQHSPKEQSNATNNQAFAYPKEIIQKLRDFFQRNYRQINTGVVVSSMAHSFEFASHDQEFQMDTQLKKDIQESHQHSFLIIADSGLGKTTFAIEFTDEIWSNLEQFCRIPLYIYIPHIDKSKLANHCLEDYLHECLTEEERLELYKHKLLLMIDGVDEATLCDNIFKTNHWDRNGLNIKVVYFCRPEVLLHKPVDALFEAPTPNSFPPYYQRYFLQPFTETKIKEYLKSITTIPSKFLDEIRVRDQKWQEWETFWQWLERIPTFKELAPNPLLLSLIVQALPKIVDKYQDNPDVLTHHFIRNDIFSEFMQQLFEFQAHQVHIPRLTKNELAGYMRAYAQNLAASLLDAEGKLVLELLDDAATLKPAFAEPFENIELLRHFQSIGKEIFKNFEYLKLLRAGCLLNIRQGKFKFPHKAFIEYLAAKKLFTGLKGQIEAYLRGLPNCSDRAWREFNEKIIQDDKIILFLADEVKRDEHFSQLLGDIILATKDTMGLSTAAANSFAVLVAAGIDVSEQDFRDVQLPGVCARRVKSAKTDWRDANLAGANFEQGNVTLGRFDGANLSQADFGLLTTINLPHTEVMGTAFYMIAENHYVLVSCCDGYIYQYQVYQNKLVASYKHDNSFFKNKYPSKLAVNSVKHIFASRGEKTVKVWSLKYNKLIEEIKFSVYVRNIIFNSDATLLAIGFRNNIILCVMGKQDSHVIECNTNGDCIAFSSDNKWLAISGTKGEVYIIQLETRNIIDTFSLSQMYARITALQFSPDCSFLAIGDSHHRIYFWNIMQKQLQQITNEDGITNDIECLIFNITGTLLVSKSRNVITLWRVSPFTCLSTWTTAFNWGSNVDFLTNNSLFIESHNYYNSNRIIDEYSDYKPPEDPKLNIEKIDTFQLYLSKQECIGRVNYVTFSPNRTLLAAAGDDGVIRLWHVIGQTIFKIFRGHDASVNCLSFNPARDLLASCSDDKTIRLWTVNVNSAGTVLRRHKVKILHIVFHPNGSLLISADYEYMIHGQNIDSGEVLWNIQVPHIKPTYYRFQNDLHICLDSVGQVLAYSGAEKSTSLYRLSTRSVYQKLERHTGNVNCVVFSPNGQWMATAGDYNDKTICLWFLKSLVVYKEPYRLDKISDTIYNLAFSHDSYVLASVGFSEVLFWSVNSKECMGKLKLNNVRINHITFSGSLKNDKRILAIAGSFGYLSIWELPDTYCPIQLWSLQTFNRLSVLGANFSNTIGLSENNNKLLQQNGAIVSPAPTWQTYQPWCTLFQPICGTANTQAQPAIINMAHQHLLIDEYDWVISVARHTDITRHSEHVFLILEGMKNNRRFIIRAQLTSPDGNLIKIDLEPFVDVARFENTARHLEAKQWNIPKEKALRLLKHIRDDQKNPKLRYSVTGENSLLARFSGIFQPTGCEFHNCVSWCIKQLRFIDKIYPQRWYHIFVKLPADLVVLGNSNNERPVRLNPSISYQT
jgi:WD40 repeat protein